MNMGEKELNFSERQNKTLKKPLLFHFHLPSASPELNGRTDSEEQICAGRNGTASLNFARASDSSEDELSLALSLENIINFLWHN